MVELLCWGSESTAPAKDWREQSAECRVAVGTAKVKGRCRCSEWWSVVGQSLETRLQSCRNGQRVDPRPRGHRRQRSFFLTKRLP